MHSTSFHLMQKLVSKYVNDFSITVLDVGSMDVNGTYKPIFPVTCKYIGLDLEAGRNVDLVVSSAYKWPEISDNSIDLIISGQAFEHIKFFWLTLAEMYRILKPNGLWFIIAPSAGPAHAYPVDCWRFYTDGMRALAESHDMEILDAGTQNDLQCIWKNSYLACRKKS